MFTNGCLKDQKRRKMMLTNCCEAPFYEPGYPDSDICTACKEHAEPIEEDEEV